MSYDTLDSILLGGTAAAGFVVVATIILSAVMIWIIELIPAHVRATKRWIKRAVRGFLAPASSV